MTAGRTVSGALAAARQVADAVLFEGYLLYPYRASAAKNRVRWQFGVLMPPGYVRAGAPEEHSSLQAECVLDPRRDAVLTVTVRFLHVCARSVERARPSGTGFSPTVRLRAGGTEVVAFDEAEPVEVATEVALEDLVALSDAARGHEDGGSLVVPLEVPGRQAEEVLDRDAGRVVRRWRGLRGQLTVHAVRLPGPYGAVRVGVGVENSTPYDPPRPAREAALRRAMVAAHMVLATSEGEFLSMVEPPEWAAAAVAECRNTHVWPVLVGGSPRSAVVLASPIILSDAPQVAPESPANLYDGTEIDEILSLRTLTLTDEEKAEARATDPRAARLVDHVDTMPPEVLERLHGAIRHLSPAPRVGWDETGPASTEGRKGRPDTPSVPWWDPGADASVSPETDTVLVGGVPVGRGVTVRLVPGARRADAHDLFLAGRLARVEAVLSDVDGGCHIAVTLLDDPAADLLGTHGRFLYFRPDEVETVPGGAP